MPGRLLLDTHIAWWLAGDNPKLRRETSDRIDACRRAGGTVYLSSVSVWEIANLVHRQRLQLAAPVEEWVERFVNRSGVESLPLDPMAAAKTYSLHPLAHNDPADRLLIASAIVTGCTMVTYDMAILKFGREHGGQHRFHAVA